MNNILKIFLIFFLLSSCSLDSKSGFWSKPDKIKKEKNIIVKEIFKKDKSFDKEFNKNIKINLTSKLLKNNFVNNLSNNNGIIDYDGSLRSISRYKFSKIDDFKSGEATIAFDKKNIIFFDNKGNILKFDESSKLVWKKNYYKKSEKKLKPFLNIAIYKNYLIVADNLAKYYVIDSKSGNLIWMKKNIAPFNSQIKIYDDSFFVTDFENILRRYSINDGKEIWNVKTETSFVKSQKKLSIILSNGIIYFNNSIGDISAVNINSGRLIWQTPTQDSSIYESSFRLKTSDMVLSKKYILLSNNNNEFFSLDAKTGTLVWQQKINSIVRPSVVDNLVFTVTEEGFLTIIEIESGNIIKITDIFDKIKKKKRSKIKPVGFVIGKQRIYLTTNNGRLIVINTASGKSELILKIDNEVISRPFILDKNLFIIKNNAIIKLD